MLTRLVKKTIGEIEYGTARDILSYSKGRF